MIMPNSQLLIHGFEYRVLDGERKLDGGKSEPIKLLRFQDQGSGLVTIFVFSLEEFETFKANIIERKIVEVHTPLLS